jgi:cobalt-zinc-cadmium resistance protein CzcA
MIPCQGVAYTYGGMYYESFRCEFIMWQRVAFAITVVLLGLSGGILALFVCGMHTERGAVAGFCFVSALAIVQAGMISSGIVKARSLCRNIRDACYRGAQEKCRPVFLVGVCTAVSVLPMAMIEAGAGAPAQFATVIIGGVAFSTTAALFVLPVLVARIAEKVDL